MSYFSYCIVLLFYVKFSTLPVFLFLFVFIVDARDQIQGFVYAGQVPYNRATPFIRISVIAFRAHLDNLG